MVIIFGVDGLGSHNLWRGIENGVSAPVVPNIEQMKETGIWTSKAAIDELNFSGPNWMGMLTGAPSAVHGVQTNNCERGNNLETIFGALRRQFRDLPIFLVHEWDIFACYPEPGSITKFLHTRNTTESAQKTVDLLTQQASGVIFIDFDEVDAAGHRSGGSSQDYKNAVEAVDRAIGIIHLAASNLKLLDRTYFVLIADHGHLANGGGHSSSQFPVPFIVQGPTIHSAEIIESISNNQLAPVISTLLNATPSLDWIARLSPFESYF